ncbi:transposase InsK for insertion sequence [Streptococcus pneumoniae]|nr:transposase InsK for insertion sequence [Streptococcus pneumoniae]
MNYTPKVRQKKSNFWGVFIMKLTYDDKVQIYELRKQGYSLEKLSNKFGINNSNIRYMIKLIDRYGIEFVKKGGNSQDNGRMESFFGILKSEMFYGYEKTFKSLNQLERAIIDYIDYYNNKRIKIKLKGLSSVQYRTKSFG